MLMEGKSDDLGSMCAGSPFIAPIRQRLAGVIEAADPGQSGMTTQHERPSSPCRGGRAHLAQASTWWHDAAEEQRVAYV